MIMNARPRLITEKAVTFAALAGLLLEGSALKVAQCPLSRSR